MASDIEKCLIDKLKSNNSSEVYRALLKVRKCYVSNQCKLKKLLKYSIMKIIIPFLEHPKFCNISLSIIADGCCELSFVREVIKYNGIQSLIRIMKNFENDDIQNTACRALGNLAKFDVGFKAVLATKLVPEIINFLGETSDINCQQTAMDMLMILGRNRKTRDLIVHENGLIHIAKLLRSTNVNLLICSIKALAKITKNCSVFCAKQLIKLKLHKVIIELSSYSEKTIQSHALISLKNLSKHEEIISDLIKGGAVNLFTDILSELDSYEVCRLAALALCNCLEHIHMGRYKGTNLAVALKALLVVVQNKEFEDIHLPVIISLVPLSYESKSTELLLKLDVLQILIEILKIFIEKHKCKLNSPLKSHFKNGSDDSLSILKSSVLHEKPDNIYPSDICNKWDSPFYSISPTSDYASCSQARKFPLLGSPETDPEVFSEIEMPLIEGSEHVLSSACTVREIIPKVSGWSPVVAYVNSFVSSRSNSPTPEYGTLDNLCFEELSQFPTSSDNDNFHLLSSDDNFVGIDTSPALPIPENDMHGNTDITEVLNSKLKTEITKAEYSECCDQLLVDTNIKGNKVKASDFDTSNFSKEIQSLNSVQCNEVPKESLDNFVLQLILKLSFHSKKRPNSKVVEKTYLSVLLDYLCLIHNPCPEAESILLNLFKSQYCLEKLVVSGFISEMEDKMLSSNYAGIHQSYTKEIYFKILSMGRQVVESDLGIRMLCRILTSSDIISQVYALCAVPKFITDKSALHTFLFQASGLSLVCNFLSDVSVTVRRKAIISLCELYQSLTKDDKKENCCFHGTCKMETSEKCCYKISYHDVSFVVNGGVIILANRQKLCDNSEYFSALLNGHFLERSVKTVSLPEISAENLSTIFHFLHGCGSGSGYCCPYITRIPFVVLLELLCYYDKFLLNNIRASVEDRLCHYLNPSTVSKIYRESKINNFSALSKRSLKFALKMDIVRRDILWSRFEELIKLDSSLDVHGDIESLFKSAF